MDQVDAFIKEFERRVWYSTATSDPVIEMDTIYAKAVCAELIRLRAVERAHRKCLSSASEESLRLTVGGS